MKFHRFFTAEKLAVGGKVAIPNPDLAHQLKRVFRLKAGNMVVLFSGDGFEYVSEIKSIETNIVTFVVIESAESIVPPKTGVHLYPSLVKKDKIEWVIQKCTELGVAEFHPVISDRSERKSFDIQRAEKIAIEAAEQSGWGRVPKIYEPISLADAILKAENPIVLESDAPKFSAEKISGQNTVSLFVGPEGGWSENERKLFKDMNIASLGDQTLRAETASVAIAALLLL